MEKLSCRAILRPLNDMPRPDAFFAFPDNARGAGRVFPAYAGRFRKRLLASHTLLTRRVLRTMPGKRPMSEKRAGVWNA